MTEEKLDELTTEFLEYLSRKEPGKKLPSRELAKEMLVRALLYKNNDKMNDTVIGR